MSALDGARGTGHGARDSSSVQHLGWRSARHNSLHAAPVAAGALYRFSDFCSSKTRAINPNRPVFPCPAPRTPCPACRFKR